MDVYIIHLTNSDCLTLEKRKNTLTAEWTGDHFYWKCIRKAMDSKQNLLQCSYTVLSHYCFEVDLKQCEYRDLSPPLYGEYEEQGTNHLCRLPGPETPYIFQHSSLKQQLTSDMCHCGCIY